MASSSLSNSGQMMEDAVKDGDTGKTGKMAESTIQAHDGAPGFKLKNDDRNDDSSIQAKVVMSTFENGPRFWAVMTSLALTSFLASLENSVVVTSGPAIVADLEMGEEYVWVANAFFVCWLVVPEI